METRSKKAVREWKPADMQEHRAGRCRGLAELFEESTGLRQNMRLYNVRALLFCSNLFMYMFTTFPNGQVYGCAIIRAVLHLFYEDLGVGSPLVGTHQDLSFEACFQFLRIYSFLLAHMYSTM